MKQDIIGADHEFHDKDFAVGWAERFSPTSERLALFNIILSELQALIPEDGRVLELGIGPGYLASHLLNAMPSIEYWGIDFSTPMLEIASERLARHSTRVKYIQADLVQDDWGKRLSQPINAIVSTWALHDLGSQNNVKAVYEKSAKLLGSECLLLNGDFIKPNRTTHEYEAGRFYIHQHLKMLRTVGFRTAECLIVLEEVLNSPTPAQNYACIKAVT